MKTFPIYYYDLHLLGEPIDVESTCSVLQSYCIGSSEGYKIQYVGDKKFFITLIQRHDSDILLKKGKAEHVSVDDLESLGLDDDEALYNDIYIYIDLSTANFFSNSLGILSVLKGGKEPASSFLGKFFNQILGLKSSITLNTITYKNTEKYLNENKIRSYSFTIATVENQRVLGSSGGLDAAWDIKEQIGGKKMKFTVLDEEGLSKDKVLWFHKNQSHNFINSASIEIDELGFKVQQKIDKIRFKSSTEIELLNKELDSQKVLVKMQENYLYEIPKIREEYNI